MIHRQTLAAKTLSASLNSVLNEIIRIVNYIRGNAANHRIFQAFCEEVGSEVSILLYHTEIRWLSKANVLERVAAMRMEIEMMLRQQQKNDLTEKFTNEKWVLSLLYLSDIFLKLNQLNRNLQGQYMTVIQANDRIAAFRTKLELWERLLGKKNVSMFI